MPTISLETTNNIVHSDVAGTQIRPRIVALSDGGYVVIWGQSTSVFGARFDANGTKIGADFLIPGNTEGFITSDVAAGDNGSFLIVSSPTASSLGISGGTSREIRVAEYGSSPSSTFVNSLGGDQIYPAIGRLSDGSFIVAWNDYRTSSTTLGDVYARRLNSAGDPVGGEFIITNTAAYEGFTGTSQGNPISVAGLTDGGYAIGWVQGLNSTATYAFRIFEANGSPRTAVVTIANNDSFASEGARLHGLSDGRVALVFGEQNPSPLDPRIDVYSSTGALVTTFRPNVVAGDDATSFAQGSPALTPLSGGRMFVTWVNYQQSTLRGAVFTSDGAIVSNMVTITSLTGNNQRPSVEELNDGSIVVVWESVTGGDWNIRSAILNIGNGAPAGANTTLITSEDVSHTFTAANFGFTDPLDSPSNTLLAVKVASLPLSGTLWLDSDGSGPAAPVPVTLN